MTVAVRPGDLIAVPLSPDVTVLGIALRTSGERMYAVFFEPVTRGIPQTAFIDAFEPASYSQWVVDTAGVRDGSWPIVGYREQEEDVPLPAFAGQDEAGRPVLCFLNEETLLFEGNVLQDPAPQAWQNAPRLLPDDPVTFEIALGNTVGVVRDPPEPGLLRTLNESRELLSIIRARLDDLDTERVFDYLLTFAQESAARDAAERARASGLAATVKPSEGGFTPIEIHVPSLPNFPACRPAIVAMATLAAEFGGTYDGFGTALDRAS